MVAGLIAVAVLTAKMSSMSAAGQQVMERHEQVAQERAERENKR